MKLRIICLLFFINLPFVAKAEIIEPCSKKGSVVVVKEDSNDILFETNADKLIYPASLVKLMTSYLAFEAITANKLTLNQELTFSERAEEVSSVNKYNTLAVKAGDRISVIKALQGLIVKSYNENAIALAEAIAKDEWSFVRLMNDKALKLGMINTSFSNASGLHAEGQYTTALDLARLALSLKKDFPQFYNLFSEKNFEFNGKIVKSHNNFLHNFNGAEGMKTGFTSVSGYNLIASAKRNQDRLFSVVTGCKTSLQRDDLTRFVLDVAFMELAQKSKNYLKKISLKKFNNIYN